MIDPTLLAVWQAKAACWDAVAASVDGDCQWIRYSDIDRLDAAMERLAQAEWEMEMDRRGDEMGRYRIGIERSFWTRVDVSDGRCWRACTPDGGFEL